MTLTTPAPAEAAQAAQSARGPRPTARAAERGCGKRLGGEDGTLVCTREADHVPGCVFTSTSGVPDRHTATSGE